MNQGSTSAFGLGVGLTLVLGVATAGCTVNKTGNTTQGEGSSGSTGTTDSEPTVGTTVGTTVGAESESTTTGNTPDETDTIATSTSTSTSSSTTVDSFDSDAAAASYAGPDEQDQTDKL